MTFTLSKKGILKSFFGLSLVISFLSILFLLGGLAKDRYNISHVSYNGNILAKTCNSICYIEVYFPSLNTYQIFPVEKIIYNNYSVGSDILISPASSLHNLVLDNKFIFIYLYRYDKVLVIILVYLVAYLYISFVIYIGIEENID